MPKIVHYTLTIGETAQLPAGSRVIGHTIDCTKGAPRVSIVVEQPDETLSDRLNVMAEQWAAEDRIRYGKIEEEREKERRFFGGTQWSRRQMAEIAAQQPKPSSDHAADAIGLMLAPPLTATEIRVREAAVADALKFGVGWMHLGAPKPSPLDKAAAAYRKTVREHDAARERVDEAMRRLSEAEDATTATREAMEAARKTLDNLVLKAA